MKDIQVSAIYSTNSLLQKNGKVNRYREAFHTGVGASSRDKTWNKPLHQHECCKSKVPWRHKVTCFNAIRNAPDDYSDLKEVL